MEEHNTSGQGTSHGSTEHKPHTVHEPKPFKPQVYTQPKPKPTPQAAASGEKFWKITTVVLIVILAFFAYKGNIADNGVTGQAIAEPTAVAAPSVPQAAPTPTVDTEALIDDDDVKGDPDAPVTIIEFSDFECPFCARFYTDTLGQIQSEYIDTGKVKLVYRDFPLSFHPNAQKAAEAAECAAEQGKFWEMHDLLFEQGVQGGVTSFKSFASQLGLDTTAFNTCLDTNAMAAEVRADMADGTAAGIRGTPGFVVNGQVISGAQPFSVFQQAIEAQLS
jgi:protein-disulfide isomerase